MQTTIDKLICSICGSLNEPWPSGRGYGNNAQPVNAGRCCNKCNQHVVLPARIKLFGNKPEQGKQLH